MNRVKPSFWVFLTNKTFLSDKKTLLVLLSNLMIFGSSILLLSLNSSRIHHYLPLIILTALTLFIALGVGLFIQRKNFRKLTSVFWSGIETNGKVVDAFFSGSRGYITVEYQHQQERYRFTDIIYSERKVKHFSLDQQVTLFINREKPSQAFIRDLYLNTF